MLQGQTLLSLAAEQGRKESVEYLLKHGAQADLHVTDRQVISMCHCQWWHNAHQTVAPCH